MDPVFYAWSKLRRRKYDDTINICTELLHKNPLDQAVWFLKCKAINEKNWLDDTEMEEEGIAEMLMDDNAIAQLPRPGTSLARPSTATGNQPNQGVRPLTSSGRPLTGFVRPGTVGRPTTGSSSIEGALQGSRPGTSRPVTTSGRFVRLGTASLMTEPGGEFVNVDKLNLSKYAQRPALAKVLFEYLLYTKNNPVKALELASLATTATDYKDWWWKTQIGRCYYKLGLHREAEKQFLSSTKTQEMIVTYLLLCKVFIRLDQPNTALEYYMKGSETFPGEISLILGSARIHDALNDIPRGVQFYKKVLHFDSSNVEAIACLASNFFYSDQPELALRYYRRLLQMGVNNTELWNNLALCCFYAQQYDMTLSCFERALALAEDDNMADVWYNLGQVAVGIGDMGLAYQCFKIATSVDSNHAESYNNLGVLDMRKSNLEQARSSFHTAASIGPQLHEPLYNASILMYKLGDFQESYRNAASALRVFPDHEESKDIIKLLRDLFTEK